MGRRRTTDRHLPARMYLEHGAYYFRAPGKPRTHLGRELAIALTKYAAIVGENWSGRTLGDVIDRYRTEILPLKRSAQTRADQAKQLERLKIGFGHFLPDSVTAQHCYKYADARRGKDGKPVPIAARHEVSLLGHVFSKAIKWGIATGNPVRYVTLERSPKRRQVTMAEVVAVRALANPRMAAAIDLAVNIGQRRGDLLTLKHSDIDDEWLHVEQSKSGAKVDLQRSAAMMAIVGRLKAFKPDIPNEYLIRKRNGRPYTQDGFSAIWQRLQRKYAAAGGKRFTFHDLRSVSADGAATAEEARDRLGHASVSTTNRYYRRGAIKAKPRE
jgi:integrase